MMKSACASAAGSVVTVSCSRSAQICARHLAGRIDEPAIAFNLGLRQVEADGLALLAELDGERQAHVSQTHDRDYAHDFPILL